jgi:predicted DNA-binding transcriptional regulator AlpA
MTEIDPDDLVQPAEVAEILGQKELTLATWRSQRRGPPYVKIGRAVLYLRSALRSWLAAQLVETGGATTKKSV